MLKIVFSQKSILLFFGNVPNLPKIRPFIFEFGLSNEYEYLLIFQKKNEIEGMEFFYRKM